MSSISVRKVTKQFGSNVALNEVSLDIDDREFVVLLGPTGAGKTTLLRCVAGLERLDNGDIFIEQQNVKSQAPAERDLAFVFQNYALYPRKTVYQNIAFPLEARAATKPEIEAEVKKVAEVLHIGHLLDRRPAQLSGGEQQRVALGRAMVRRPHAFLMDEPLTNLDFKLRTQMRSELKRIQRELNETFFYVTNDQVEAMSMADRIAVLNRGVIQQVGLPQDVYEHPVNLFVASFIGSPRMNLIQCSLDTNSMDLVDSSGAWRVPVPAQYREKLSAAVNTDSLLLGVRAEDVLISAENSGISGDVYVVEPLGDRIIYDIRVGTSMVKVKTPPTYRVQTGSQLNIVFNMDRVHIFDARTQQALI
ncbi:MAG: ABC transporter ATP-binding protein [Chloroflexota bacterium]